MRVIHVATAWPRHPRDPITPWLVELLRRQRDAGHRVSVLAPAYRGGPAVDGREADGPVVDGPGRVPVERFRYAPASLETLTHDETVPDRLRRAPVQGLLVPAYLAAGALAARRLGRREAPDVVHVHWPMPHAVLGSAMRGGSGGQAALVCSYYSVEIHWVRSRLRPLMPFLRWTARTADEVTAISTSTATAVRGLIDRPVPVIPYGAAMSDDGDRPSRGAFESTTGSGEPGEPVRILFVGRLVERKGVEVLVRAVADGRGTRFRRPVELRIVGAGEWEGKIRGAAREAGLEPRFLGRLSDAELRSEYEAADVFVLPAVRDAKGDTEGLGVVLLEALRFERPVIGSDIGGIPDIIEHGETGLLVPPGEPGPLADAIARLIGDPGEARALARRGRAHAAREFGWDRVVGETTAAYERAIEARRRTDGTAS